jgi:DNA-binding transcriptional regulator GbsR (MarR family)
MHQNLTQLQEKIVDNVKEYLKILEVTDKRPVIVPVLALAERPLTEQEITARSRLSAKDVHKGLTFLTKNDLIVETVGKDSGKIVYELNCDMEKVIARNIQEKIEDLRRKMKSHVVEYEDLLESAKADYNEYDTLMAKFLREKVNKMKLVAAIMTKRNSLLRLLDTGVEESAKIEKISIE